MKKSICSLLFFFEFLYAEAQNYPKHQFLITKFKTDVLNWPSVRHMQKYYLSSIGYAYFFHKNWGAKIAHQSTQHTIRYFDNGECYFILGANYPRDSYDYAVLKHTTDRLIKYIAFTMLYRLNYKKHTLLTELGISNGKEVRTEMYKDWDMFWIHNDITVLKEIGYCASLSYQFRVYRNFGLSADVVLRQSKDIPTTLSYGVGLTYSIFNKKRTKNEGN